MVGVCSVLMPTLARDFAWVGMMCFRSLRADTCCSVVLIGCKMGL